MSLLVDETFNVSSALGVCGLKLFYGFFILGIGIPFFFRTSSKGSFFWMVQRSIGFRSKRKRIERSKDKVD